MPKITERSAWYLVAQMLDDDANGKAKYMLSGLCDYVKSLWIRDVITLKTRDRMLERVGSHLPRSGFAYKNASGWWPSQSERIEQAPYRILAALWLALDTTTETK